MLILSRRIGETLYIEPSPDIGEDMTVRELFAGGPIVVALLGIKGKQAKIGVQTPESLLIVRSELLEV